MVTINESGKYTLFSSLTGRPEIDSLTRGVKWGGAVGTGATVTYSFPGTGGSESYWSSSYPPAPLAHITYMSADERAAIRDVLSIFSMYANIKFVEVTDGRSVGQMRFAKSNIDGFGGKLAVAYPIANNPQAGDVWFDRSDPLSGLTGTVGAARYVALHEIGHALGLKHPNEGAIQSSLNMDPANSVMGPVIPTIGGMYGSWASPMLNDVLALQRLYGKNIHFNTDNTLYNANKLWQTFGGSGTHSALWDAGGIDTLVINVVEFSLDPLHPKDQGLRIVPGAVIENLTTRYGYGTILGNSANNVIKLNGDMMPPNYSGQWSSRPGADIRTGLGNDTVYLPGRYYDIFGPITIDQNPLFSPNLVYAGSGNDTLYGSPEIDNLYGESGNDYFRPGLSIDLVNGGSGSDTVDYSTSSVFLEISLSAAGNATVSLGGTPFDTLLSIENLTGGSGNDVLFGNDGSAVANFLRGGKGSDSLNGQQGNDTLQGGLGYDYLTGGTGSDFADYSDRSLAVSVTLIAGATVQARVNGIVEDDLISIENLRGGGGRDRFIGSTGANILDGGAGDDQLAGGIGSDTLYGGAGNDRLRGDAGTDKLNGGLGKDMLTGGADADLFIFSAKTHSVVGINADRILDFDDGNTGDRIDISALFGPAMTYRHNLVFTGAGQVRINDIAGADVIVEVNTGGTLAADFSIRLVNTTLSSMNAGDFVL
ncbi:MAG TPA: matrixin family metalloprotease [Rhizobiaceae bacterium]|nr:matrixin family metalloprotease [Rhizobiaceae bacterium]